CPECACRAAVPAGPPVPASATHPGAPPPVPRACQPRAARYRGGWFPPRAVQAYIIRRFRKKIMRKRMRLGIDTGGTFTDFALLTEQHDGTTQLCTLKVLSTPQAPEQAILQGLRELGL